MLRSFAVSTLVLGSALALMQPQIASARDRDDARYRRDRDGHRGNERREVYRRNEYREPQRFERGYARPFYPSYGLGYAAPAHRHGYGDPRFGYWDRFGDWCWY